MSNRIPLQTDVIPTGTGLVQAVECKGVQSNPAESGSSRIDALEKPVTAQIVTFANGIRHICCLHAEDLRPFPVVCSASKKNSENCIYAWEGSSVTK